MTENREKVLNQKEIGRRVRLRREHLGLSREQLAEKIAAAMAQINEVLPKYKHVNHFILTDEPMVKTTTQKVKRRFELEKINANWDDSKGYNVVSK